MLVGQGSTGLDLSGYDAINVDLDYNGPDTRLRFYIRNYEPGFSDLNNILSAKFINTFIPASDLSPRLSINFRELAVAEWWITAWKVPRALSFPDLHHVISFGIDFLTPTVPGRHDFKLKKLEFVGVWISKEHWYLGILTFWIIAILSNAYYTLWSIKRKNAEERERLQFLINKNSTLEYESHRYKQLSMVDPLTGLFNRNGVSDFIISNYGNQEGNRVSLIIVDIDFFKNVNDTHGHDVGDQVLAKFGDILRGNTRATDRAARWGGEEFILVLPNSPLPSAYAIAEKLRAIVEQTVFEGIPGLHVTISLGVGEIQEKESFHLLFGRVDRALYDAKAQGRNRVVVAGTQALGAPK
jgi:diguanylate cyclase (GGDEF)-like protein